MRLYHGSPTGNIKVLEPRVADHGSPYVYLSTRREVAAIYLTDGGQRPCYWFPYGYTREDKTIYFELWPDAIREVSQGRSGWIYSVEAEEDALLPFAANPKARLSDKPVPVAEAEYVPDVYEWLLEAERRGELVLRRYEDFTPEQLAWWHRDILDEAREKNIAAIPDHPYARLMQEKFPRLWEELHVGNGADQDKTTVG